LTGGPAKSRHAFDRHIGLSFLVDASHFAELANFLLDPKAKGFKTSTGSTISALAFADPASGPVALKMIQEWIAAKRKAKSPSISTTYNGRAWVTYLEKPILPDLKPWRQRQNGSLDKIFVRDLVIPCFVGAFEEEKGQAQRVRFQVEVSLYPSRWKGNDDVNSVVSYDLIVEAIHAVISTGHINLLETLAERIAAKCLAHRRAAKVYIRIEKLDRLDGARLGVEIERSKSPST
jgi:dihydroneopterin aldolase